MNRPKLYDPKNFGKPRIRLPDEDGPNPYDSKTGYQPPQWLSSWGWWFTIIGMGASFVFVRHFFGG